MRYLIKGFIRCFHQFVSLIFFTNFSQFEQLKKKTNFLLVQNWGVFQFATWKRNHNKYWLKFFVDNSRLVKISGELVICHESKQKQTKQPKFLWKSHVLYEFLSLIAKMHMNKSMHFLWSVEKWLHIEKFWEVSVVVVKKNISRPSSQYRLYCKFPYQDFDCFRRG